MQGGTMTRPITRALAALAVLVAALSLVACGGSDNKGLSKTDYKNKSQAISDKLKADLSTAQQNLQSGKDTQALTGLNQFKSSLSDARTKLEGLDPPSDFKDVHNKLVDSLKQTESSTQQVIGAAQAKDKAKAQTALQQFQTDLQSLNQVGDEYDKKVGTKS
jgi:major membrane immunogen (membrane-anchored lipoprotein)